MRCLICFCADAAVLPPAWIAADNIRRSSIKANVEIFVDMTVAIPLLTPSIQRLDPALHLPEAVDNGHLSTTAYMRLIVPHLLADRYDRILYLDCDTLAEKQVDGLFDLDLQGRTLAATANQFGRQHDVRTHADYMRGIGVDPALSLLNSGLLLIDVAAWNARNVTQRCMNFLAANHKHLTGMDQDTLNAVLADDWTELSPSFNLQTTFFDVGLDRVMPIRVTHYKGPVKPWHDIAWPHGREHVDRYKDLFARSPWPDFIERQRNLAQRRLGWRYKVRDVRWGIRSALSCILPSARRRIARRHADASTFRKGALTSVLESIDAGRYADVVQGLTPVDTGRLRSMIKKAGE